MYCRERIGTVEVQLYQPLPNGIGGFGGGGDSGGGVPPTPRLLAFGSRQGGGGLPSCSQRRVRDAGMYITFTHNYFIQSSLSLTARLGLLYSLNGRATPTQQVISQGISLHPRVTH